MPSSAVISAVTPIDGVDMVCKQEPIENIPEVNEPMAQVLQRYGIPDVGHNVIAFVPGLDSSQE